MPGLCSRQAELVMFGSLDEARLEGYLRKCGDGVVILYGDKA